jgi:hypothetical protein
MTCMRPLGIAFRYCLDTSRDTSSRRVTNLSFSGCLTSKCMRPDGPDRNSYTCAAIYIRLVGLFIKADKRTG